VGSNPFGAMCIFLILARCRLYGGMRMGMSFARRGNENDRYRMVAEHGNDYARGGENRKGRTCNGQNAEWLGSRDIRHVA
jgi:hypothetical protein